MGSRIGSIVRKARESGLLKPVKVEAQKVVSCPPPERFIEIIDDPVCVTKEEVTHIRSCPACTKVIMDAAKIDD